MRLNLIRRFSRCHLAPGGPPSPVTPRFALVLAVGLLVACSSQTNDQPAAPASVPTADNDPLEVRSDFPVVEMRTSAGTLLLKLDGQKAPGTVRNFLDYVNEDFYSGTIIHYVATGKMILGGGYIEDGTLKPTRLSIRNEAHNGLQNMRGSVAMAREPDVIDSATSQFFINLADAPALNYDAQDESPSGYGYCVFGQVVEGMDVAESISERPTTDRGNDLSQTPEPPVVIESMRVVRYADS